jgi:hypothetical protein
MKRSDKPLPPIRPLSNYDLIRETAQEVERNASALTLEEINCLEEGEIETVLDILRRARDSLTQLLSIAAKRGETKE